MPSPSIARQPGRRAGGKKTDYCLEENSVFLGITEPEATTEEEYKYESNGRNEHLSSACKKTGVAMEFVWVYWVERGRN